MKHLIISFSLLLSLSAIGQKKITYLYDKDLLSTEVETNLSSNLKAYGLEYTSNVDLNHKCDYLFANLQIQDNKIFLSIKDCYDNSKGKVLVGNLNQKENAQAYAGAISFLTNDILQNPDKYKEVSLKETAVERPNEHASRYFFAPSGYNMKKGELYLSTNYFLAADFQYGLTDNFSLGMGSTIAAIPFYITPKASFKVGEKSRVAVGDMLILGTWGVQFTANLVYGVYTYGNSNTNVSLGLAYLTTGGADIDSKLKQPVINLSGMARLSENMYIVSENYFTMGTSKRVDQVYLGYDPLTNETLYDNYNYTRSSNVALGALGFRFISKKRAVQSVQFGLAYFINSYSDKYENDIKPPAHDVKGYKPDTYKQFFIPTISFCYKFGRKV